MLGKKPWHFPKEGGGGLQPLYHDIYVNPCMGFNQAKNGVIITKY